MEIENIWQKQYINQQFNGFKNMMYSYNEITYSNGLKELQLDTITWVNFGIIILSKKALDIRKYTLLLLLYVTKNLCKTK